MLSKRSSHIFTMVEEVVLLLASADDLRRPLSNSRFGQLASVDGEEVNIYPYSGSE